MDGLHHWEISLNILHRVEPGDDCGKYDVVVDDV